MVDSLQNVTVEQTPPPGKQFLRFYGECIEIRLTLSEPIEGAAYVRTNLGNAHVRRKEIIAAVEEKRPRLETDWDDVPMERVSACEFVFTAALDDVGVFEAKAFFAASSDERLYWPPGENLVYKVEPASFADANTVYTAFVRQFGTNKASDVLMDADAAEADKLEDKGCTVIPPSGTFRDLIDDLDFIISDMGFRVIQLLPIHPVPTTFARMGRFGSPFAALDFEDVDHSLAEFDRRTTPMEQFMELVQEIHARDARVFLDIAVNHTGWASQLQIHHPEWFPRNPDGSFRSPGAWGIVWEDLSELDYGYKSLWEYVADVFLYWCEKGVDGFRCDAGYMLPFEVWEYVVAKVREVYPETVFLLEGLGGKLCTTENLLGKAGLNWAYSELFQNYNRDEIELYLPLAFRLENTRGLLVQYAETHDNERLAKTGTCFSQLRTALCALCSQGGAFGITNGVEWYADKKVDVHGAPSLNWGAEENQIPWLRRLNALLCYHPACRQHSERRMIQRGEGNSLGLFRKAPDTDQHLLVLANLSSETSEMVAWETPSEMSPNAELIDLLRNENIQLSTQDGICRRELAPGEVRCLSPAAWPVAEYENHRNFHEALDFWRFRAKYIELRKAVDQNSGDLPKVSAETIEQFLVDPLAAIDAMSHGEAPGYTQYLVPEDLRREVMVPPGFPLVVITSNPFMLLEKKNDVVLYTDRSLPLRDNRHFVVIPPADPLEISAEREVEIRPFLPTEEGPDKQKGAILRLCPMEKAQVRHNWDVQEVMDSDVCCLAVNTLSSVAYARARWSEIKSQYDCILSLNPAYRFPGDRRVLWTRCRCWVVYKDYSREMHAWDMCEFSAGWGQEPVWRFSLPLGRGYTIQFRVVLSLEKERNRVTLSFCREDGIEREEDTNLPSEAPVTVIVRPDIEDRGFHEKTKAFQGPEELFPAAVNPKENGFTFKPGDNELRLEAPQGMYVNEPEWHYIVAHPIDGERGFEDCSDLFSPGYFHTTLQGGENFEMIGEAECTAEAQKSSETGAIDTTPADVYQQYSSSGSQIAEAARTACRDFVVTRDASYTVIAGFPWFLDWGRDTLICLRGIIAMGWHETASCILQEFARFEQKGTLPNMIHGQDASNRDTSDAPLWFFTACHDLLRATGDWDILESDCGGRNLRSVLVSIAENYCAGTPNGVKVDNESGLIYSPEHYTWMDTQHPAGTPRAGYPIEIQALWATGLDLLCEISSSEESKRWRELRENVAASVERYYVRPEGMGLADCLHAKNPQMKASECVADDHRRPNQLFAVTLANLLPSEIQAEVVNACWPLLVPGGLRTLADEDVAVPLPVQTVDGTLLNDPKRPYKGHYVGDEDTARKPAYHNGTAWCWLFPSFCEALIRVYGNAMSETAGALLGSTSKLFNDGCAGHLPEIVDGDAPHIQRGCSAQAWSVTEVARVARLLEENRENRNQMR